MMKDNSLYNLILKCKSNDNDSFALLCEKFKPLLKKYSRLLEYDDAYEDLLFRFLICIYKIPLSEKNLENNDIAILSYIKVTMKNQYIYLNKRYAEITAKYMNYDDIMYQYPDNSNTAKLNSRMLLWDLKKVLNNNDLGLLYLKFYLQYTDKEIAASYGISRQAVNKRLHKIIKTVKKLFLEGMI